MICTAVTRGNCHVTIAPMSKTGIASRVAPRVPNAIRVGVIIRGPIANPTIPPTVKRLIVVACRAPLRYLTRRAASGMESRNAETAQGDCREDEAVGRRDPRERHADSGEAQTGRNQPR